MYQFKLKSLYVNLNQAKNGIYTLEIAKKKDILEYQGTILELINQLELETAIERSKLDIIIEKLKKIDT